MKRTDEEHFKDIMDSRNEIHSKGVIHSSMLLEIPDFSIMDIPHDPMHIILEGLAKYHTIDLFQNLLDGVDRSRTSISEINTRLRLFDYGKYKSRNRPLPIYQGILNDKGNLRWTASMTWNFIIFAPFILEDIIDISHEYFNFFNLLRIICLISFSTNISMKALRILDVKIKDYIKLYCESQTLSSVPKIHYLSHLVEHIER